MKISIPMNKPRRIARRYPLQLLSILVVSFLASSCAKREAYILQLPSEVTPPVVYCFDTVGHKPGAKPWILGGTCCCTPSEEVLADYKKHGHVTADMTLEDLIALYEEKGIHTALDHQGCNNMCEMGPHVVKGGKCMVPPTPMTQNYEEVFSGQFEILNEEESIKKFKERDKKVKYHMLRGRL